MNAKLILIRHGQSQWNLENRFTGWQNVGLTEKGEEEAHLAGIQLKGEKLDIAFTSTLLRAQKTLDIILEEIHFQSLTIISNKALNERCYGELEGLDKAETALKYGEEQVLTWRRSYDVSPPGGESLKNTFDRVIPYFLNRILPLLEMGEHVLVVAHGNSLRSLIMFLEDLTPEQIQLKELPTGVPQIYDFSDEQLLSLLSKGDQFKVPD